MVRCHAGSGRRAWAACVATVRTGPHRVKGRRRLPVQQREGTHRPPELSSSVPATCRIGLTTVPSEPVQDET